MHTLGALAALAVLVSPVSDVVTTTPRHKFHTLPELLKAMDASPVKYGVNGLDKLPDVPADSFAKRLWPQMVEPVEMPRVTRDASGKRSIVPWPVPAAVEPLIPEAERLYMAKDFKGAAAQYRKILEVAPDFYLAEASLGDCALFSGDPKTALDHYDAAIRRNPDDYRLHFYRGNALMESGKKKEAIDAFTTSLMLKPRNPIL